MKFVMKTSLCLLLFCVNVGATILFIMPRFIQFNKDYTMVISNMLGETNYDCLLNISIEGNELNLNQTVKVMGDTNQLVSFKIPHNISWGQHYIIIKGKHFFANSTVNIHRQEWIYNNDVFRDARGLIQLNKPVITPGELLQFRLIVVDGHLKPASSHNTSVSVYVKDPNDNVIQQWSNVSLYSGVFENQIAIPTIPVLGTYIVETTLPAGPFGTVRKTFEVKNYDIDTIDLNIYPTVVPLLRHQGLNLTVDVKNYVGKTIKGNLTIYVYDHNGKFIKAKAQTWDVNGRQQIYLPFHERLQTKKVVLLVAFIEQYTNRRTNRREKIILYDSKYKVKLKLHNRKLKYHQGTPFKATLAVTYQNDEPAKNETLLVVGNGLNLVHRQKCKSDMNGEITFSMHTNKSTELYNLEVYEDDIKILNAEIEKVDNAYVLVKPNIKVEILTHVKFNRMLRLLVTCSHNMTILLYYLFRKGNIVEFGSFRLNQTKRYSFQVMISDKLIPRSTLYVATLMHKSLIQDKVEIFINDFGNPLEIKIEENIGEDGVDPGDEIELGIRGRPGAFVALAAYDQRLMQHGKSHDIVFEDLWQMFDTYYVFRIGTVDGFMLDNGLNYWVTDNTITVQDYFQYKRRGIYPDAPRYGMPGPHRTDFSNSWLWQNLTIPPSGRAELVVTVPHSTTSWFITGITIDPKYGLGVVKKPITFSTVKIFYILDHLPHSIKRGETVSLHFTLFSTMQEEFEATVTLFNTKQHFRFVGSSAEDTNGTKHVSVPSNYDAPVSFLVKAMKLGELEIRVNASIMQGVISDSFKKIIRVLPEDVILRSSKRIHFDRDTPSNHSFENPLFIDNNAENGSIEIVLNVSSEQQTRKGLRMYYNLSLHFDDPANSIFEVTALKGNYKINSVSHSIKKICVSVISSQSGVILVGWKYRLNLIHFKPGFNLQITKLATSTVWMKELYICCSFIPEDIDGYSNGSVVELSIPIGYAIDNHNVVSYDKITTNSISVSKILHDGTTLLVLYKHMGNETACFSVFAYRRYKNRVRHPSYVKVEDLHRPELNAVKMFDFH